MKQKFFSFDTRILCQHNDGVLVHPRRLIDLFQAQDYIHLKINSIYIQQTAAIVWINVIPLWKLMAVTNWVAASKAESFTANAS